MTILIDSNALAYSAFFKLAGLTYDELHTGVIFGFLHSVLKIASDLNSNDLAFCWDSKKSWRKKIFPEYKSNRSDREFTEEEIRQRQIAFNQFTVLRRKILPGLGFSNVFMVPGYEADDIIGWLARKKQASIMVSGDNDLYQLLDFCDMYRPIQKDFMTKAKLKKEYGITPKQFLTAKAIGGCRSDGVPGIFGIGDSKSPSSGAVKYVAGKMRPGKLKDRIESKEGVKIFKRNLKLVIVPFSGPLESRLKAIKIRRNKFDRKAFIYYFSKYGLRSFLSSKQFAKWEKIFEINAN